jgi:hypothetical protein
MKLHALSRAAVLAGTALVLPALASAQGPAASGQAIFAGMVDPEPPFTGYAVEAPMPPKVLMGTISAHPTPPIPEGPFRPGPNSPETEVIDPAVVDAGVFRYFQLEDVDPAGASTSVIGEPSVAATDHVVFQTGNWYAARSVDNGASWTHVNPATFFPSVDNGFCCDQRIVYIPSRDITVWVLQYSYSSTTQTAGYRIAVANGDADLANPSASAWTTYYITPQNRFGFGNSVWFDFPDIAYSNDGFFLSANVFSGGGSFQGSVIIRTDLTALQANGSIPLSYINSITHSVEFAPRMAKGGSGDRIFWCCLENTSSVQVGWFNDSGSFSRVSRSIGSISQTVNSTPTPDGVNWARQAATRFRGAYGNSSEVGFLITSGSTGASRPNPHVRVVRFSADDNRNLIGEHDIFSSTGAWGYAAAGTNSLGHVGIVAGFSSPTAHLRTAAGIIDNYNAWTNMSFVYMGAGDDSPNQNRWGDYLDVHQHPRFGQTFIGTGMSQRGGSANGNNVPQFAWFGRDDYEPTWVNLAVQSTGVSGVSITLDETDMSGLKNGTTSFNRRFAPNQPYTLTAPSTVTSGSTVYAFERWRYRVSPTGSYTDGPIGDRVLSLSTIGSLDDTAIADYKIRRTLTVQSSNPASGVSVTCSPDDLSGLGNGTTSFTRRYRDDEVVSLTAPEAVGFNPFRHWLVDGLVNRGGRAINLTMTGDRTAVAVYSTNVAGSVTTIGAGCVGSNGTVPTHSITWPAGQQGPQQGAVTNYRLTGARPSTGVALNVGLSNRSFNGLRLPLDLGIIGVTGCSLYHDIISSQSLATDTRGGCSFPITWPADPAAIGRPIYSSYTIIDPGVRRPLPLTLSNALELRIGGNQ